MKKQLKEDIKQLLMSYHETIPENFKVEKALKGSAFVKNFLTENNIPFKEHGGNIYSIKDNGLPLLSSHMDSVGKTWPMGKSHIIAERKLVHPASPAMVNVSGMITPATENTYCTVIRSNLNINIGADDRAGGAIIMALLKYVNKDLNFIFSRQEETSPHSVKEVLEIKAVKETLKTLPYCLVLDRRGFGDIIGGKNKYCQEDFIDALESLTNYGFTSEFGSISDGEELSEHLPTVNLSVGYYNPHTETEYIIFEDWLNTLMYCKEIIATFKERFELKKKYQPVVYNRNNNYNLTVKKKGTLTSVTCLTEDRFSRYFYNAKTLQNFLKLHPTAEIEGATFNGKFHNLYKEVSWGTEDIFYDQTWDYEIDIARFTFAEFNS